MPLFLVPEPQRLHISPPRFEDIRVKFIFAHLKLADDPRRGIGTDPAGWSFSKTGCISRSIVGRGGVIIDSQHLFTAEKNNRI